MKFTRFLKSLRDVFILVYTVLLFMLSPFYIIAHWYYTKMYGTSFLMTVIWLVLVYIFFKIALRSEEI